VEKRVLLTQEKMTMIPASLTKEIGKIHTECHKIITHIFNIVCQKEITSQKVFRLREEGIMLVGLVWLDSHSQCLSDKGSSAQVFKTIIK